MSLPGRAPGLVICINPTPQADVGVRRRNLYRQVHQLLGALGSQWRIGLFVGHAFTLAWKLFLSLASFGGMTARQ